MALVLRRWRDDEVALPAAPVARRLLGGWTPAAASSGGAIMPLLAGIDRTCAHCRPPAIRWRSRVLSPASCYRYAWASGPARRPPGWEQPAGHDQAQPCPDWQRPARPPRLRL